jgi:hypothetical protein
MEIDELDFNGTWTFRSFFNDLQNPEEPLYMGPWALPAQLEVEPNRGSMIKATLKFATGIALNVTGWSTPYCESEPSSIGRTTQQSTPSGVILRAEGAGAIYELRGFAVTPTSIVGTVRCRTGDLARRADGTIGPFILFRACDCQALDMMQRSAVQGDSKVQPREERSSNVRAKAIRWISGFGRGERVVSRRTYAPLHGQRPG